MQPFTFHQPTCESPIFTKAGKESGANQIGLTFDGHKTQPVSEETASKMSSSDEVFRLETETTPIEDARVKFLSTHADTPSGWRVEYFGKIMKLEIKDDIYLERLKSGLEIVNFGQIYRVKLVKKITKKMGRNNSTHYWIEKIHGPVDS